jgi:DNA-binding LacI/PurR family transcriptional regulator
MGRITIRDVAKAAGVSTSAVSRVFTDGASASATTRARVNAAAKALGYRPNALARALVGERTNLVALVIGQARNVFDSLFLEALADALARHGQNLLISLVHGESAVDEGMMSALDYQADAVVVAAGTVPLATSERCLRLGVPIILCGRVLEREGVDCILGDNRDGARQAAELLVRGGCRRIAYLGRGPTAYSDSEREDGLRDALARLGLAPVATATVDPDNDHGFAAATALLSAPLRPDAVFCGTDLIALGVLETARALGLRVPEDVAVIGFDNVPMSAWPSFRLTTVDYPIATTAETVVERIQARLAEPNLPAIVRRIPTRLVARATTRRIS